MRPKGVHCTACNSSRFGVYKTYRPRVGLTVRYCKCKRCESRFKTEEKAVPAGAA